MPLTSPLPRQALSKAGNWLGQFLSWWGSELRETWEDWSLYRSAGADGRGRVQVENGDLVLSRLFGEGTHEMARLPLDALLSLPKALASLLQGRPRLPADLEVILPQALVLCREVHLPAAVGRRLPQVVAYQLERMMPLRAELIYHHCALVEHDAVHRRLRVAVSAARRTLVDDVAKAALEAGARRVSVLEPERGGRLLRSSRARQRSSNALPARRLAVCAGALSLLLAAVLGWRYQDENQRLAKQAQALRRSAAGAEKLRDELDGRLQRMSFLATRLGAPAPSQVLAELTRVMPTDSWLFQFQAEGAQIDIAGFSSDASAVTAAFAKSPMFRDAALRSAVKSPGSDAERFDIAMRLRGAAP